MLGRRGSPHEELVGNGLVFGNVDDATMDAVEMHKADEAVMVLV